MDSPSHPIREGITTLVKSSPALAVSAAASTAWTGCRDAARQHPRWLGVTIAVHALAAVMPAAQVLLINRLLTTLNSGQRSSIAPSLVGLTIVVGCIFPLSQVAWQCGHRLGLRLNCDYHALLTHAAARLSPGQIADPAVVARLQSAESSVDSLGPVPAQAVQWLATLMTAVTLCVAVGRVSAWSAALVGLSLLPTIGAFTVIARFELAGLPALGAATRRARYATELLVQQRTATDLAVLQSGHQVAEHANAARREFLTVLDDLTARGTRWELSSGAATAILLGAALAVMASTETSVAAAAAAVAGVISALHAVRQSSNSFGQLVSAAPKALTFHSFVSSVPPANTPAVSGCAEHLLVRELSYRYPGAATAALAGFSLAGFSMEARRGEVVALVGANGAGKTTAVGCIVGALTPESGSVQLDGEDLATLSEPDRLARFGLQPGLRTLRVHPRPEPGSGWPRWIRAQLGRRGTEAGRAASLVHDLVRWDEHPTRTAMGWSWPVRRAVAAIGTCADCAPLGRGLDP